MAIRWVLAACALLAAACGPTPVERAFRERVEGLESRAAFSSSPSGGPGRIRPYPEARERRLPLEDVRLGVFGYLSLDGCELQGLAARKSSPLGRVMPSSQRFVHEHTLLAAALRCAAATEDDARRALLAPVIDVKRRELPAAFWNASFGSDEVARYFTAAAPLGFGEGLRAPDALEALFALRTRVDDLERPVSSSDIEGPLARISRSREGGALLQSLDLLARFVDGEAAVLEARCDVPPPDPRLDAYEREMRDASLRVLSVIAAAWAEIGTIAPEAFREYFRTHLSLEAPESPWSRFETASERRRAARERCRLTS